MRLPSALGFLVASLVVDRARACDPYPGSSSVTHAHTVAPGVFVDWTFGRVPGLGFGARASYLSHGKQGFGGFAQISARGIPQREGSTYRLDGGALFTPMALSTHDGACESTIHATSGGYFQAGGSLFGPTDAGPRGGVMLGAYASSFAFVGVTGFFADGPELAISVGVDVPFVVQSTR